MLRLTQKIAAFLGVALFAAMLLAADVHAQDSHYWTNQYGTQAQLLGGAVVGRGVDLSATYYNPAAIVFIHGSSGVVLTTDAFQYQIIKLEGVGLDGEDVQHSRLGTRPSIFTGLLPSTWVRGRLAYSFVTRMDLKVDMDARTLFSADVLPGIPGEETYFGERKFRQEASDFWYGLSYADSVNDHLAFGATGYVNYHGQRTRRQTLAQVTEDDGESGATAMSIDEFTYWKMGLSLKLGLAIDLRPLSVGITFTTGRLQFPIGDGRVITTRAFTGLPTTIPDSDIAADEHEKLTPTFKWPMSAAVGMSYDLGDMTLHVSSEWFSKIDRYTVLDSRSVTSQVVGQEFDTRIFESRKEVINLGLGYEYRARESLALFGSFWTDRSAHPGEELSNHTQHIWSINHISAGVSGDMIRAQLTLGISWSWGRQTFESDFGFQNPNEGNGLVGEGGPVDVVYRNLGFLIGFSF